MARQWFFEVITEGQKNGEIKRDLDPETISFIIRGTAIMLCRQMICSDNLDVDKDMTKVWKDLVKMIT